MKNVSKSDYEPHICEVCSKNSDSYPKTVHDDEAKEHCNSKQKRPCHRIDSAMLKRQDMLLNVNKPPRSTRSPAR